MKTSVLADAGPLYAAVDPSDKYHSRALRELRELSRSRFDVIISFSTLVEAYSLVLHKMGRTVAFRWLSELTDTTLINPTPEDYRQAAATVVRYADQPITLFDATLAVLTLRMGARVWTYDHHFDVMRVPVWR